MRSEWLKSSWLLDEAEHKPERRVAKGAPGFLGYPTTFRACRSFLNTKMSGVPPEMQLAELREYAAGADGRSPASTSMKVCPEPESGDLRWTGYGWTAASGGWTP